MVAWDSIIKEEALSMSQKYESVPEKESKPVRVLLESIIAKVQKAGREQNIGFRFQPHLVGSGKRHLITRIIGGNEGFDFDYNLEVSCNKGEWKPKFVHELVFNLLREAIKGTRFNKIEESTSVITIKQVKGDRIIVSCDFSIMYYPDPEDKSYYKYVRFNKKQRNFTWEERALDTSIDNKIDWLRENINGWWDCICDQYRKVKNNNNDDEKTSFELYAEAINNIYNHFYYQECED